MPGDLVKLFLSSGMAVLLSAGDFQEGKSSTVKMKFNRRAYVYTRALWIFTAEMRLNYESLRARESTKVAIYTFCSFAFRLQSIPRLSSSAPRPVFISPRVRSKLCFAYGVASNNASETTAKQD